MACGQRARTALAAAGKAIDPLLARLTDLVEPLRKRLKQGAKTLAAVAAMRVAGDIVERVARGGWAQRLPWHAASRADLYVAAAAKLVELGATRPDDARRSVERAEALLGAWDELLGPDATRWAAATGLSRRLRAAAGQLEECLLALVTPGAGQGAGWAEGRLRGELDAIGRELGEARHRLTRARADLVELRPVAQRAPESRRARLLAEVDATIAALPDLSLGADLGAQVQQAAALAARIRSGG